MTDSAERMPGDRGSRSLLDFLIDRDEDLMALVDAAGRLVDANESFCRRFRVRRAEAEGRPIAELMAPFGQAEAAESALETAADGTPSSYVTKLGSGSEERVFEARWTPHAEDGSGRISHAAVLFRDVTDFVEKQRELMEEKERAETANRAKNDFLAIVSHELRTPLNAVIGLIDLSLSDADLDIPARDDLQLALEASHRLLGIVDDILDLVGIESGRLAVELIDFDPAAQARGLLRSFETAAARKGLELGFVATPDLPPAVVGDALRFGQILGNLVDNAVKFTQRGRVVVRLSPLDPPQAGIRIEVSDTGIGIEPTKLESIFDEFVQGEEGAARRFGGAGLGLAIVRRLVALLDGSVSVRSQPGQGSTFTVDLRLEHGDPARVSRLAVAPPPLSERPLDILVVEDDEVNALVGVNYLKRAGHRPERAESGEAGLALLAAKAYDLVLMDIQMPGIDGFEATRRIRRGEAGPDAAVVPILAMTAHAASVIADELRESGMDGYVSKPIMAAELAEAIARATGGEGRAPGRPGETPASTPAASAMTPAAASSSVVTPPAPAVTPPAPAAPAVAPAATTPPAPAAPTDPTAASSAQSHVLDLEAALERLDGDRELLREIAAIFISEAPEKLRGIAEAIAGADHATARRLAHSVRGAARSVGANELAEIAELLESAALACRSEAYPGLASELGRAYERLTAELEGRGLR